MIPWLQTAGQELGVKEIPGEYHNDRILEYLDCVTMKADTDETPWCSAFVNWVFRQHEILGTEDALARSWLKWGQPLQSPRRGCVIILRRGTKPWQGHVGFYMGHEFDEIRILGGNQGNQVSIVSYPAERVLGYRWFKLVLLDQ